MSITSKPAVTPEIVEKARQFRRGSFNERWKRANPNSQLSREDQESYTMAEFAASAVQDAVRECADMVQHRCDNAGYALVKKESLCRELAAALREKYGVKP